MPDDTDTKVNFGPYSVTKEQNDRIMLVLKLGQEHLSSDTTVPSIEYVLEHIIVNWAQQNLRPRRK